MKIRNQISAIVLAAVCVTGTALAGAAPAQAVEWTKFTTYAGSEDLCNYSLANYYREKKLAGYQTTGHHACTFSSGNWNGYFYYG